MKLLCSLLFFGGIVDCCLAMINGHTASIVYSFIPFCVTTLLYMFNVWEEGKSNAVKKPLPTIIKEVKENWKKSFLKAVEDYNTLQDLRSQIADGEIAWQLATLQQMAEKILQYLEQNPERISVAEEFIEIYQDKVVGLIQQYIALEKVQYSCSEMDESKSLTKKMLSSLLETYKKEFEKILNFQFMNFNTEINVFQRFLGK